MKIDLQKTISNLPNHPGVYQFYDSKGDIIYIGKAKNLKKRVSSYFNKEKYESYKTKKLASKVYNVIHIVVETEADALLLENNLIKQHQPKYNILLKDDKTFPWICIKNEPFPRVFSTRNKVIDGSEYFGPYTSSLMVKTLLNLIKQLYQIRTCSYSLSDDNILRGKFKPCLEYHLDNCLAPCIGKQSTQDYEVSINIIRKVLRGNLKDVQEFLYKNMIDFASRQQFEEAEKIKSKYELLDLYKSKSTIVNPKLNNLDVYSFIQEDNLAYVNYLKIIEGAIVQSHTVEIINRLDETKEELLQYALIDIRQKTFSDSKEILIPFDIGIIENVNLVIPKIGDKKKLIELSERNARQFAYNRRVQRNELFDNRRKSKILDVVKNDLRLKDLPYHIECFDNSNIQGTNPVAACVVFKNAKPSKKDYRHYHIKTVIGANDFASMEEVINRRYKRIISENKELPQLIIIDGGKGQLSAAVRALKNLGIYHKIAIIGIAKKLEELFFPNDSVPLYLDKNSRTLKLVQNLRNEAHRFGITFHRDIRSKHMLKNQLEEINGIGIKTIEKLIIAFGSIENIKQLTNHELEKIISKKQAEAIVNFFKTNQ